MGNAAMYQVVKLSDLAFIIEHLDNWRLKSGYFSLFKQAFYDLGVKIKEHLTKEGFTKLVNIRATLNKGLPKDWVLLLLMLFLCQDLKYTKQI